MIENGDIFHEEVNLLCKQSPRKTFNEEYYFPLIYFTTIPVKVMSLTLLDPNFYKNISLLSGVQKRLY